LAALIALLLNQALGPVYHPPLATRSADAAHSHHIAVHAAASERRDGGTSQHGYTHQTCHFCRVLGALLPQPTSEPLDPPAIPSRLSWEIRARPHPPLPGFSAGHPVRGPPLTA
jgi:hypothetical protein